MVTHCVEKRNAGFGHNIYILRVEIVIVRNKVAACNSMKWHIIFVHSLPYICSCLRKQRKLLCCINLGIRNNYKTMLFVIRGFFLQGKVVTLFLFLFRLIEFYNARLKRRVISCRRGDVNEFCIIFTLEKILAVSSRNGKVLAVCNHYPCNRLSACGNSSLYALC